LYAIPSNGWRELGCSGSQCYFPGQTVYVYLASGCTGAGLGHGNACTFWNGNYSIVHGNLEVFA